MRKLIKKEKFTMSRENEIIDSLIAIKDLNKRILTFSDIETLNDACNCIQHLAKREEAKPPVKACRTEYYSNINGNFEEHFSFVPECSKCGSTIMANRYDVYPDYCPHCGQHINWTDWFKE